MSLVSPRVPRLGAVPLVLAVLVAQPQTSEALPQFVNFPGKLWELELSNFGMKETSAKEFYEMDFIKQCGLNNVYKNMKMWETQNPT